MPCGETPLCLNCAAPQGGHRWFCPKCGFPGGEYVVLMPYLQIFTVGEVLRRGVTGPPEKGFAIKAGLVVYSLTQYAVFAPLYWFWMARKARGKPIGERPETRPAGDLNGTGGSFR